MEVQTCVANAWRFRLVTVIHSFVISFKLSLPSFAYYVFHLSNLLDIFLITYKSSVILHISEYVFYSQ